LIDGRFEATPDSLRLMGAILGVRERADTLARYVEALFADLEAGLAAIPADDRPRVYFARGPEGLETGLKGSINTEIIELAGGRNVADPGDAAIRRGITDVSIEQVIVANPDTIITWDRNFYQAVWNDPIWRNIPAVAAGRVWLSPTAPFGWIDRPPSVNRVIGLKWLSGLFYPERFDFNLAAETRQFYKLFYHVDLSDDELDRLLEWARGRPAN
jgi:iron complex transport system substrate-binding protein